MGYDACFFCLGTSAVGMSEEKYKHITYDLTLNVGRLLAKCSPEMTFCYAQVQVRTVASKDESLGRASRAPRKMRCCGYSSDHTCSVPAS